MVSFGSPLDTTRSGQVTHGVSSGSPSQVRRHTRSVRSGGQVRRHARSVCRPTGCCAEFGALICRKGRGALYVTGTGRAAGHLPAPGCGLTGRGRALRPALCRWQTAGALGDAVQCPKVCRFGWETTSKLNSFSTLTPNFQEQFSTPNQENLCGCSMLYRMYTLHPKMKMHALVPSHSFWI